MCFIDNTCYPDGQQNPSAECSICKSDLSRTAWTLHDGIHFVLKLDFMLRKKKCCTDAGGISLILVKMSVQRHMFILSCQRQKL